MSIYTMGIDVGSTASKCVILKDGSEIVAKSLVAVGTGTSGPSRAIAQVLENAGMTREQMDFVLATGYGRNSLDGLADMQMSELSCHAKGAAFLFPNVRTVVDIGGQDVKVIEIENGMMKNFVMNDKCAAGTGRFFEAMARSFELSLPEFSKLSLTAKNVIPITAQCTVFAESEVITLVGEGKPMDEIAAAAGLARREVTAALESVVEPLSLDEPVYTDGGDAMYVIDQVRDPDGEDSWISGLQFRQTVAGLTPREKRIMELRYLKGETQMEVAREIGISQAQVSRLEKAALEQFRHK